MNVFDIITIAVFFVATIVCVWKGFLNILLKLGALVIAVIVAKLFGKAVGEACFSDLIGGSGGKLDGMLFDKINESLVTIMGTVLVFAAIYILLRIIFFFVSKLLKKAEGLTVLDRILGAVFGLVTAFGLVCVFAVMVRVVATVAVYIDPSSAIFDTVEETVIFKYFF